MSTEPRSERTSRSYSTSDELSDAVRDVVWGQDVNLVGAVATELLMMCLILISDNKAEALTRLTVTTKNMAQNLLDDYDDLKAQLKPMTEH